MQKVSKLYKDHLLIIFFKQFLHERLPYFLILCKSLQSFRIKILFFIDINSYNWLKKIIWIAGFLAQYNHESMRILALLHVV